MKRSSFRATALAVVPLLLVALGAGSASAQLASGKLPPPPGFEANSASFVSAQVGYVLGARGCSIMPCKARMEKTVDGGKHWTKVPMPAVKLVPSFSDSPRSAVGSVRFENARDGWVFGPGLWATTNGGSRWHRVTLAGNVIALAASNGTVFAVTEPVRGGLLQSKLFKSKVGTTKWTRVPGVVPQDGLTVFGRSVWAGIASSVGPAAWRSTDSGKHWTKLSFRCPKSHPSASPIAAASPNNVALGCSNHGVPQPGMSFKDVFTSTNGGRTFHLMGHPGVLGQIRTLAMPPGHPKLITIAADSGATFLYQSRNGGKTWTTTTFFDGGLQTRDLAYVSATTGYLVHFNGGPAIVNTLGLMKTVNAGKTWTNVTMP